MAEPRPIAEIAERLGIAPEHRIPYGNDKAKIELAALDNSPRRPGRLVLVSAITPTPAGEGKTTTSIGLAQGFQAIGESVCLALREPSLGPVFGVKGGAIGGGKAMVTPGADINLHFTGDFHAISAANNLLAALLDNHLQQGNQLGIDVRRILWRRVIDLNDRALRNITVGLGGVSQGVPRETGFDITPASEIMAILCLSKDYDDLRARLGRIVVALTPDKKPVTAADLEAVGGMLVVLKDALKPNLVQTLEGVPAFIHGGPFANIAHGCNSVVATKMAMAHADWTITEAGFAFDLGAEKFLDIKCRSAGLSPAAIVLVATIRALKMHGGVPKSDLGPANAEAVERGLPNLERHLESIKAFGKPAIVALNRFGTDTEEEIAVVRKACEKWGVPYALNDGFEGGGPGGAELAEAVKAHAETEVTPLRHLYDLEDSPEVKMEKIAKTVYGARGVEWAPAAKRALKLFSQLGGDTMPLCVAKTQNSLSDNPKLLCRPTDFDVTVRDVVVAAGAGFLVPLLGDIMRMPGLPKVPQSKNMDLVDGKVVGMG